MDAPTPLSSSGEDAARGVERRLMAEAASGGQAALARVYDLTSAQVFGLVLGVVRDRTAAEEVLQETYLHAWQHAADYDASRDTIAVWLCGIAHRYAVAHTLSHFADLTPYEIAARTAQTVAAVQSPTREGLSGLHDHSQRSHVEAADIRTPEPA
ncbi:sigma factor [Microbacterium hydrocarbonoxydans]|uniref:sigma factor n=1 Tax=Microbacterium hydrocarbonoxydans TaxID=273678 RepID=UPI00203D5BD4|nr:sigma factor [Microbacterium hydrocarbonoxydans]MCM3778874.1 hypothetical protein [Microbacterium hydrocarbonoxydans]